MPTLYPLTSVQALASLRIDLSDVGSARWNDAALNRALDLAVEKISEVYPLPVTAQTTTVTHVKRYPFPAGAWWVDSIEYPMDRWPRKFTNFEEYKTPLIADPTIAPAAARSPGAGLLSAGIYSWAYTFVVPGGHETLPSPLATLACLLNDAVTLTGIPQAPEGVVGLNLYRTAVGGAQLKLSQSFAGFPPDLPTTVVSSMADGSLGTNAPVANTTQGWDAVYLLLPPELTPPDSVSHMAITGAAKHQLDVNGTTIPERFWDALFLGARTEAQEAYVENVLDNFEFADGMLRDKVDDTKSMIAWQEQARSSRSRFTMRLNAIKQEFNAHKSGTIQWGDIPLRGERV